MTKSAYINGISCYLPGQVITNQQLSEDFPTWSVAKVTKKIGVTQRHVAEDCETSVDMAVKAAEKLFLEHSIVPAQVDFVLLCTQSPDYFLPSSACIIQDRLGVPVTSGALDFSLGCSGFVYGLAMAKGLVSGGIASNILLITSETYSKYIHHKDKGNRTIFGDGATATLVSEKGLCEIADFDLGTDGRGADNLIVKTGGSRSGEPKNDLRFDENDNPISSDHLYMNGPAILNFTLDIVPKLVLETLSKNNLAQEDVDLFVFHQANSYLLNLLRKKIGIPEDKFFVCMSETANTVSSTIPIALAEAIASKTVSSGSKVLIAGFGVGYSWAGTVLQF